MTSNMVSVSDEKALIACREKFRIHRDWIQTFYSVSLPCVPYMYNLKEYKEFCVGLLEKPDAHPWFRVWEKMPEKVRYGIAHSLFLLRKVIPSTKRDVDTAVDAAVKRLTSPQDRTDPKFLRFIEREIGFIFSPGWDKNYEKYCAGMTLSTRSVLENPRSNGGARNLDGTRGIVWSSLTGERIRPCEKAMIQKVVDGGKVRVVTSNPVAHNVLKPLHAMMYDYLAKKKWLLRGDAKPKSFREFTRVPGEIFVSGDYESATDNIPHDVYRTMLRAVASVSSNVPANIFGFAQSQVRRHLVNQSGKSLGWTARGQLMGSFLSFPFLCLLNYLCFKYAIGRSVPVRINGDDIVFRSTREEADRWFRTVGSCGLILSRGKTLVHERVFTLNSSMFYACDGRVRNIHFLRAKAAFSKPETPQALAGQYQTFQVGRRNDAVSANFLRYHGTVIWCSQRSVTRGLSMKVNKAVLRMSGLWKREQFYLSCHEPPLPDPSRVISKPVEGWRCYKLQSIEPSRRVEVLDRERKYFSEDLVQSCWTNKVKVVSVDDYWTKVRLKTLRYFQIRAGGIRKSRLYLRLSNLRKGLPLPTVRLGGKRVWVESSFS